MYYKLHYEKEIRKPKGKATFRFGSTANIGKRGDSGCIKYLISVSAFSTVDNDALRKPRLPILANRYRAFKDSTK